MNQNIDKIEHAEVFMVRLPLVTPFETSFGVETDKEALLLKLSGDGVVGYSECTASSGPYYSYETNRTAIYILKNFLIPILHEASHFSLAKMIYSFAKIRGHRMAKATIDNALLDLLARKNNLPVYQWLGGQQKKIPSGISIGIKSSVDELLESVQEAVDKKYHRIKIKIKRGRDIEILSRLRKSFPHIQLMVDANSDYDISDLPVLKKMDEFNLMMIEQPLYDDDIYFHSLLQHELRTPICLDESIKNVTDARAAVSLGACRVINIKQGRVGGMLNAKTLADYCQTQNIGIWSGGMLETGIGRAFNIHLQTLPAFNLPGDTSETSRYFDEDIVDQPVVLDKEGLISIPAGIGIGVNIVEKILKKYTVFSEKLF